MKTAPGPSIEQMDGRSFIMGREGHIYLDSPTASKHHAEISIVDGKVFLRDLGSTNGTFLVKDGKLMKFESGYVSPMQRIVIGKRIYIIKELLAIARDFAAMDASANRMQPSEERQTRAASE